MIILYDEDTVTFDTLGLGVLKDAITCEVSETLNGTFELEMEYPIEGSHYKDIQLKRIIGTKVSPYDDTRQHFRIYGITKPINGVITVTAQHISYDGSSVLLDPTKEFSDTGLTKKTLQYAVAMINAKRIGTDAQKNRFTLNYDETADYSKDTAEFSITSPISMRNSLSQLIEPYKIELKFDNFGTMIYKKRGNDNGVTLNYGKNLSDLEENKSYTTNCHAIYPYYWKNTTETSSGVSYDYQKLLIDATVPEFSYNWLYNESESTGVIGKVKQLITSTLKSYIFRISDSNTVTTENNDKLYLWNSYEYINVTDIDDWEMASESTNESDIKSDILGVISKLPVIGTLSKFIPSKEKMKCVQSLFTLYYSVYNAYKTSSEGYNKFNVNSSNDIVTITALEDSKWNDQNRTNLTLYYDDIFGSKSYHGTTFYNAVYIKINDTRIYCCYQKNANLRANNFLYLGPEDGCVVDNNGDPISFFGYTDNSEVWNNNTEFVNERYMVYVNSSKESSYNGAIFIPRKKDTIIEVETEPDTKESWPTIYKSKDDDGKTLYYMYKENTTVTPHTFIKINVDSGNVYENDIWVKLATIKGLDPAYPSTGGATNTKTEKVTLSKLGTFYGYNTWAEDAHVVPFSNAMYMYIDSNWKYFREYTLSENDAHIFLKETPVQEATETNPNPKAYTFRNGQSNDWDYSEFIKCEKLPTSDYDNNKIYEKALKDGTYEYYIRENSKWLKFTNEIIKDDIIFSYITTNNNVSATTYYKNDFNSINIVNSVNTLPETGTTDALYLLTKDISSTLGDSYKGCIFIKPEYADLSNILVQGLDLTSFVDDKESDLFTNDDLTVEQTEISNKLLEFIGKYYINKEENNPNKLTNETTLTYMRIEENSEYMDYINLYKIEMGDTIHVNYKELGIVNSELRVKELTYDVIKNCYTDITLGEKKEDLSSSVVTTSDGVSVLANDNGYTDTGDVNNLITKNIKASYISTENFNATNATIDNIVAQMITTQQLNAIEAEIEHIKTDPMEGTIAGPEVVSYSGDIVTSITEASLSDKEVRYESGISYDYDNNTKVLTITFTAHSS